MCLNHTTVARRIPSGSTSTSTPPIIPPITPPTTPPTTSPTTSPTTPPIIVPTTPPTTPQFTPILDYTGLFPIANQELIGGTYTEIKFGAGSVGPVARATVQAQFISLSPPCTMRIDGVITNCTTILALMAFDSARKLKEPTLVPTPNVIIIDNAPLNPGDYTGANSAKFAVNNTRAIGSFGNSSYFGVAMHLIYVMADIRHFIETDPTWHSGDNWQKYISELLGKMGGTIPKDQPIIMSNSGGPFDFPDNKYLEIKKIFYSAVKQEEDPLTFLSSIIFTVKHISLTGDLALQKISEIDYHVMRSFPPIHKANATRALFPIGKKYIDANPTAELQQLMSEAYKYLRFKDGANTETVNHMGHDQAVFAYRFDEITQLPRYLLIELQSLTSTTKSSHDIDINLTLTMTAGGTTIKYFFMGAIIHLGPDMTTGRYSALIFSGISGNQFQYNYYNNAIFDKRYTNIVPGNRIVRKQFFYQNTATKANNEMPYILLYVDMNHIK